MRTEGRGQRTEGMVLFFILSSEFCPLNSPTGSAHVRFHTEKDCGK